jgi:hypothetical protein
MEGSVRTKEHDVQKKGTIPTPVLIAMKPLIPDKYITG